jgi:hypothetical protein
MMTDYRQSLSIPALLVQAVTFVLLTGCFDGTTSSGQSTTSTSTSTVVPQTCAGKIVDGGVTVKYPNGTESMHTGQHFSIEWERGDAGSYVKIELIKSGNHYLTISTKATNSGGVIWVVPSDTFSADERDENIFKIRVTSTSNACVTDDSDGPFHILS